MSVLNAAELLAAIDRSTIQLDPARCLHFRDRHATCEACFGICPAEAITRGKLPSLDADKCEGCLACLTVCPSGAYHADDAVAPLLNSVCHVEGDTLELLCTKNPQPEKGLSKTSVGIRVKGCLAGLGTGAYLALAAFGVAHIAVRTEACGGCKWAALQPLIEDQIKRAQHFLEAWGKSESIACLSEAHEMVERPWWDAENPPLSRRELFRMMTRQGQIAMACAIENGEHATDQRPGRDRLRTLAAVAHLPPPEAIGSIDLNELGFASKRVSEACTACGACARACPTGALTFEKDEADTRFALIFSPRNCIACDFCAHVCVPSAIVVDHKPSFAEVFGEPQIQLLEGELMRCERCGAIVAKRGTERLCDLCEYRRTHRFGAMLPPVRKTDPLGEGNPADEQ